MPGFNSCWRLGRWIFTAKTVFSRSSLVCTFLGGNSARGEM